LEEIQRELNEIGDRLQQIEATTRDLEKRFADAQAAGAGPESDTDDQEDLIYSYLEQAKETCCLFRRQEELMYQKREHQLEEEHADIEYKIRVLDQKPAFKRTQEDTNDEATLLDRLVEVIDERNEVVENMERIDKRVEFNRRIDKLRKLRSEKCVDPVLERFLKENDIKGIETKTIVVSESREDSGEKSKEKMEKKERKRKEKEQKLREKLEEKERQKQAKKEQKMKDLEEKGEENEKQKEKEKESKGKGTLSSIKKLGTLRKSPKIVGKE
jgi:hypothetical protein